MRLNIIKGTKRIPVHAMGGGLVLQHAQPLTWEFAKAFKTWEITIPRTPENSLAFDNHWERNHNLQREFDAELEILGVQMRGTLYLTSWTHRDLKGQFVSTLDLWSREMGNLNLREDFDWSELEYTKAWQPTYVTPAGEGQAVIIPAFAFRGEGWKMGTFANPLFNVDTCELGGAVRMNYMLDKVFSGWDVEYDLHDSTVDNEFFSKIYNIYGGDHPTGNSDDYESLNTFNYGRDEEETITYFEGFVLVEGIGTQRNLDIGEIVPEPITNQNATWTKQFDKYWKWEQNEAGARGIAAQLFCDITFRGINTNGTDPKSISWNDISLTGYIDKLEPGGVWEPLVEKLHWEDPGATASTYTITHYDMVTLGNMDELDTAIIHLPEDTDIRVRWILSYRPSTGITDDTAIIQIDVKYREAEDIFLRFWRNGIRVLPMRLKGVGATVPGNWWIPNWTVNSFIKNFLTTFGAEMLINWENKTIKIFNRGQRVQALYDLTPKVKTGTLQGKFWPLKNWKFQWSPDQKNKWEEPRGLSNAKEISTNQSEDFIIQPEWSQLHTTSNFQNIGSPYPIFLNAYNAIELENLPNLVALSGHKWSMNFNNVLGVRRAQTILENQYTLWGWQSELIQKREVSSLPIAYKGYYIANDDLAWNEPTTGLYDAYHKHTVDRITTRKHIECVLILDTVDITDIYYIWNTKNLSANWSIKIPEWDGVYQIINLERINDGEWAAELLEVINW